MRYFFVCLFIIASAQTIAQPRNAVFKVHFALGNAKLSPEAQRQLDSLIYMEALRADTTIAIVGYTDYTGTDSLNDTLSELRAQAVRTYLETYAGFSKVIKKCFGKGEVPNTDSGSNKQGIPDDRKVEIIVGDISKVRMRISKPRLIPVVANTPVASPPQTFPKPQLKVNQTLRLNNLYFKPGSSQMLPESKPSLDSLYMLLRDYPAVSIQIEGHICCLVRNTDAYDEYAQDFYLSVNRARMVYEYLLDKGIDRKRMKYKGFGRTRPIVKVERTLEDENRNRRVEIRITGQ